MSEAPRTIVWHAPDTDGDRAALVQHLAAIVVRLAKAEAAGLPSSAITDGGQHAEP